MPHQRKVPRRFESGSAAAEFPSSAHSYFRQIYYEGLDLIINCIKHRFEQDGYMVNHHLQDVFLNAARHFNYSADFDFLTSSYGTDFDCQWLMTQLELYTTLFQETDNLTLQYIISYVRNLTSS